MEVEMALTWKQFKQQVRKDKKNPRRCGCRPDCPKPLEPRVDGERHTIDGREVHSDCYFDALDKVVTAYPPGGGRRYRR
jgi:hypothetical protein